MKCILIILGIVVIVFILFLLFHGMLKEIEFDIDEEIYMNAYLDKKHKTENN